MKKIVVFVICGMMLVTTACTNNSEKDALTTYSHAFDMITNEITSDKESHYIATDNGINYSIDKKGNHCRISSGNKTIFCDLGTGYVYVDKGNDTFEISHILPFGAYDIFIESLDDIEKVARDISISEDELSFKTDDYNYKVVFDENEIIRVQVNNTVIERVEKGESSELPIRYSYSNEMPLLNFSVITNPLKTVVCPLIFGKKTVDVVRFDCDLDGENKNAILQNISYVAPVFKLKKEASLQIVKENLLADGAISVYGEVHFDGENSLDKKEDEIHINIVNHKITIKYIVENLLTTI